MRRTLLRRKRTVPRPRPSGRRRRERPASYYQVGGLDLAAELRRLCRLTALGGPAGRLVERPPELTVRRAAKRPRARLGFAIPEQNRLSVTVYPGIRRGDLLETLLPELVHLAIGPSTESRRWHGREFAGTLRNAMAEAYGITGVRAPNSYHGAYAEALEQRLPAAISASS
jgi:hypothetical protein